MPNKAINFSKLRRGMVFWYNPDPDIDKNNVPHKTVNGFSVKDYTMYGDRPYVVVSSDEVCRLGKIVQVCPIGTKDKDKELHPYDVVYNSFSDTGMSTIRCEQIRTVNSAELFRYECMLDDDIMDQVADKLQLLLGISSATTEVELPVISMGPEEVEDLIDNKLVEVKEQTAGMVDTAIARILNAISSLLNTKTINPTVATKTMPSTTPPQRTRKQIIVTNLHKKEGNHATDN